MDSTALTTMSETKMMERINNARFPQELSIPEKKLLAQVAITYGFDPLMGEISIYQGRPYVSIDGRYRKAQETGNLIGVKTRPATKEEREAWEIPDGDYFFHAEVYVKGGGFNCFEGWGRVRKAERNDAGKFKPVDVNPQRMAEKRAEAQALRKAFHIPLPSLEARGTDDDEPLANIETGEIIEATATEVKPPITEKDIDGLFEEKKPNQAKKATAATGQELKQAIEKVEHPDRPKRDPSTIKDTTALQKALFDDFGLQPKEALAELNIKSWLDLSIPVSEAYRTISAVR
jgi:hypothetical protein